MPASGAAIRARVDCDGLHEIVSKIAESAPAVLGSAAFPPGALERQRPIWGQNRLPDMAPKDQYPGSTYGDPRSRSRPRNRASFVDSGGHAEYLPNTRRSARRRKERPSPPLQRAPSPARDCPGRSRDGRAPPPTCDPIEWRTHLASDRPTHPCPRSGGDHTARHRPARPQRLLYSPTRRRPPHRVSPTRAPEARRGDSDLAVIGDRVQVALLPDGQGASSGRAARIEVQPPPARPRGSLEGGHAGRQRRPGARRLRLRGPDAARPHARPLPGRRRAQRRAGPWWWPTRSTWSAWNGRTRPSTVREDRLPGPPRLGPRGNRRRGARRTAWPVGPAW